MGTQDEPPFVTKIFLLNTSIVVLLLLLLSVLPLVYSEYRFDSPDVTLTQEISISSTGQDVIKEAL